MVNKIIKRLFEIIQKKWSEGVFFLLRRYFIAYISYFLFKVLEEKELIIYTFGLLGELLGNKEKVQLSFYVTILFLVEFIIYFLMANIVELFIEKWIKRNESKSTHHDVLDGISNLVKLIFKLVVFKFKLLSIESLKEIKGSQGANIEAREREEMWKETVDFVKNLLSFILLVLITIVLEWNSISTYWIVSMIFIFMLLYGIAALFLIYIFIENLNIVFSLVESYAQTILRHAKKQFPPV